MSARPGGMSAPLAPDARDAALARRPGWRLSGDGTAIERRFVFADFGAAFAFMTRAAAAAERLDHHPDWSNSYRTVDVTLTTHSAGGLTAKDFELAALMDAAAAA